MNLKDLRIANLERQRHWDPENKITATFRAVELGGEVGEALNEAKKLEREQLGLRGSRTTAARIGEELADVIICTDLLASMYGIDLSAAVVAKFNATSEKVGIPTRLSDTGVRYAPQIGNVPRHAVDATLSLDVGATHTGYAVRTSTSEHQCENDCCLPK